MTGGKDKKLCSGCTACAVACPCGAIEMRPDSWGFLYPAVNQARCTKCGICDTVCPFHSIEDDSLPPAFAYAVRHRDISQLERSQSGAAFIALSDRILERGGVLYGAGYSDHFKVTHKRAASPRERDDFRGSKYVQSYLGNIFREIKRDLLLGKDVLFSGTPCQVAGLYSCVEGPLREKLYLVDLVCHGVIGPYIWRDYLKYLEHRHKKRIVSVHFRDKRFGWRSYRETFRFNNGRTITPKFFIYRDSLLRPSCGSCPFAGLKRLSDITIGDFWGIEKSVPEMGADNKGCSLLFCNTRKGEELFGEIADRVQCRQVKTEVCLQPNLISPTHIPRHHSYLEWIYRIGGFVPVWISLILLETKRRIVCRIKLRLS